LATLKEAINHDKLLSRTHHNIGNKVIEYHQKLKTGSEQDQLGS